MESADMRSGASAKSDRPLAHLLGGFIGESYCTNIVRLDA
jgi:hypothetical protein